MLLSLFSNYSIRILLWCRLGRPWLLSEKRPTESGAVRLFVELSALSQTAPLSDGSDSDGKIRSLA